MAIMQPRLHEPVLMEAYALTQRRYEPFMRLEAMATRPYEPRLESIPHLREVFAQAYSKTIQHLRQLSAKVSSVTYLDDKMQGASAVARSMARYSVDYIRRINLASPYNRDSRISRGYRAAMSEAGFTLPELSVRNAVIGVLGVGALTALIYSLWPSSSPKPQHPSKIPATQQDVINSRKDSNEYTDEAIKSLREWEINPLKKRVDNLERRVGGLGERVDNLERKGGPQRGAAAGKGAGKPAPKAAAPAGEIFTHEIATDPNTVKPK
ncbi:hypothetical protein HY487_00115 [Candidatus Woesearchaeota archaeon]|nr:hypothetical protein [Candidatus Woesearchaeota archaeon]